MDLVGPLDVLMLAWRGCLFLREGAIFQSGTWFTSAPLRGPTIGGTGDKVATRRNAKGTAGSSRQD